MTEFTATEKYHAILRELGARKKIFPRQVKQGVMSPQDADYQIKIFEAIAADYKQQADKDRLA